MENKNIIDARGLSCPQPVLMTKKATDADKNAKTFKVLVDNGTAKENVTRYAQNAGFKVTVAEDGEDFCLTLTK